MFKDALGREIITEFSGIRPKTYVYVRDNYDDDDDEDDYVRKNKKAKGTKNCVIKRRLIFENDKDCWFNDKIILKSQQRLKVGLPPCFFYLLQWESLRNDEKGFLFHLNSSFGSQDI